VPRLVMCVRSKVNEKMLKEGLWRLLCFKTKHNKPNVKYDSNIRRNTPPLQLCFQLHFNYKLRLKMTNTIAKCFLQLQHFFLQLYTPKNQQVESNKHMLGPWTLTTFVINLLTNIVESHFQLWSMCEWTSFIDVTWHHLLTIIAEGHFQFLDGIHSLTLHDIIKYICKFDYVATQLGKRSISG
jgi:hypothetical protein